MDGAAMGPALITKRVDAAPFAHVHEARLQKQAREQGTALKRMSYKDAGMDLYALTVIARDETIAKDPEMLRAFLRATLKGMTYAWDPKNIEEGAKYVVTRNPEVDLDAAVGAARVAALYGLTDDVKSGRVALGQADPAKVRKSIDVYTQYLKLKRKVEADEVYTNDLLPRK
jgi:NitT/TauT family transport system substrate-binding protein